MLFRSLRGLKILSCIAIFLEVTIFAYLPYRYQQLLTNKSINVLIGCFTAGLFLGTSLLHVLPQSNQQIQSALRPRNKVAANHSHDAAYGSQICIFTIIFLLAIENYFGQGHHSHSDSEQTADRSNNHIKGKPKQSNGVNSKVILTQMALGIHSFFECMSLGIQTEFKTALTLFVGIIIHKWAEGLTLGYAYKKVNMLQQTALKYIILYATMNAAAILLGWRLSSQNALMSGILNSISAGTFLYMALIEKIREDFEGKDLLPLKLLALTFGVIFVSII